MLTGAAGCAVYFQKLPYIALPVASTLIMSFVLRHHLGKLVRAIAFKAVGFLCLFFVVGLPFFGISGIIELLDTHLMMLVRDGRYRTGANNIINPAIFFTGLSKLFELFQPFLFLIGAITIGVMVQARIKGHELTATRPLLQYQIAFACLSIFLLTLGIAKHFISYYSLSISAVFPILTLLVLRNSRTFACLTLLAVSIYAADAVSNQKADAGAGVSEWPGINAG